MKRINLAPLERRTKYLAVPKIYQLDSLTNETSQNIENNALSVLIELI